MGTDVLRQDVLDAWTNAVTSLGISGKDAGLETHFELNTQQQRAELNALYEQEWLFARCIDAVPEYGTQKWIRLGARSPDGIMMQPKWTNVVADKLERLAARDRFEHAWKMDRLDGGSYVIIGTNGGEDDLESELTPENCTSVDFLNVVSRFDINPFSESIARDPTKANYLQPEIYTLAGASRIHSSRVLRFDGIKRPTTASEFTEAGISISSRVYDSVRKFGEAFGYFAGSFKSMVQGILQMKGLASMLASDEASLGLLIRRLSAMAVAASGFNKILLDQDETYQNAEIDFTGAGVAILRVMDLVAGASETPLSILFGQSPSGMSTDDESGRRAFYSMVARQQGSKLRAPLRWIVELVMNSEDLGEPLEKGTSIVLDFVPLDEPTAKERSEINRTDAEADTLLVREAVITEKEARSRISKDPQSPYDLDEEFEPMPAPGMDPTLDPSLDPSVPPSNVEDQNKPGVAQDVQSTLPNGAQLAAQQAMIVAVAAGELSRESGIAFLTINFGLAASQANALLGPVGFKPIKPEPIVPPPGSGPIPPKPGKPTPPNGAPGKLPVPVAAKRPVASRALDSFDPSEDRDDHGEWSGAGGGGGGTKGETETKWSPSEKGYTGHTTVGGKKVDLVKDGKRWELHVDGKRFDLGKKASFGHAKGVLIHLGLEHGKLAAGRGLPREITDSGSTASPGAGA